MRSIILVATILTCCACGKVASPPPAPPPPGVQTLVITAERVPLSRTFIGRTAARTSVEIRARVQGTLLERPFQEGATVKAGEVLFRIDPREYEAAVASARAAQGQAQARLALSESDLGRIEPLAADGRAAQEMLDARRADVTAARAQVEAAQANLTIASLNLERTTITAPFTGRIGKSTRDPGALVGPADGALTTLDEADPIAVEFSISEREVLDYKRRLADGSLVISHRDTHGDARVTLVDGSEHPHPGTVDFADVRIRPETGTARMRALIPNPGGVLVPGQFARISIAGIERPEGILVPQAAVLHSPLGATVYVIGADGVAEMRRIQLGMWVKDRWLVEGGLKAGERIAITGLVKVRPGRPVTLLPDQPAGNR